jgi:hypothetical protein
LEASRPVTFNNTGFFEYADTVEYEGGFVMTGTIRVIDQGITTTNPATFDTVGAFMVPAEDSQDIAQVLRTSGFGIDSMTTFQDLRTAEDEDGDQQSLLVWTTN